MEKNGGRDGRTKKKNGKLNYFKTKIWKGK